MAQADPSTTSPGARTAEPDIRLERAYDDASSGGGPRVLVDRLWPRGVSKEEADLALWLRSVAPSDELREWFDHDPDRWAKFREHYRGELEDREPELQRLEELAREGTVSLVYAAKDEEHNNAVVLREVLEERLTGG